MSIDPMLLAEKELRGLAGKIIIIIISNIIKYIVLLLSL